MEKLERFFLTKTARNGLFLNIISLGFKMLMCLNILPVFRCCSTIVFPCYKYFNRKSHAPFIFHAASQYVNALLVVPKDGQIPVDV
ncbi:hypothetical protein MKW92_024063 [Papaver armeniacum]|nr:hypothetical protein MKW92_024063 [Papaver armeniacum]